MRKSIFLLVFLATTGTVAAFSVSLETVNRTGSADKPAVFNAEIENNYSQNRTFRIIHSGPKAQWFEFPNRKVIGAGNKKNFSISITPEKNAIQLNYEFTFSVIPVGSTDVRKVSDYFSISSDRDVKVTSSFLTKNNLMPGERLETNISLVNTGPSNIQSYSITGVYENTSFAKKSSPMGSGQELTFSFNYKIPEDEKPGRKNLKILLGGDGSNRALNKSLTVGEIREIEYSEESEDRLLTNNKTIKASNEGNIEEKLVLNTTIPSYVEPLTRFSDSPTNKLKEGDKTIYEWNKTVRPEKEVSVSYQTSYWPIVAVFGFILAIFWVLKKLKTDFSLEKTVADADEGVKVHIEVENKSEEHKGNLELTDFISDIASVQDSFPMAKPVIRKTNNGTSLSWIIEEMEPGEQRVFEYKIKPQVKVEGGITLPGAELKSDEITLKKTDKVTAEFKIE